MKKIVLFLAALLPFSFSEAAITPAGPAVEVLPGNGFRFLYPESINAIPAASRTIVGSAVTDAFAFNGPGGALTVNVARTVGATALAGAIAGYVATATAPVAAGFLLYNYLQGSGVQGSGSGLQIDSGSDVQTVDVKTYTASADGVDGSASSYSAACSALASKMGKVACNATSTSPATTVNYSGNNVYVSDYWGNRCRIIRPCPGTTDDYINRYYRDSGYSVVTSKQKGCTEAATGAFMAPRLDGKCPTGRYEGATESQVKVALDPVIQNDISGAIKAALETGIPIPSSNPTVTGPASQTGTPTTTQETGPTGTTTTTSTPTYNFNYAGDTVTYNKTVNTVTNNYNSSTNTTTTTTKTQTVDNPEDTACKANPNALGCLQPGTPPVAEDMPTKKIPVSFSKDSRWSASAGSCTSHLIHLSSGPVIDLWKPFCDFFGMIRGVVVGMFALAGALVFRNGLS